MVGAEPKQNTIQVVSERSFGTILLYYRSVMDQTAGNPCSAHNAKQGLFYDLTSSPRKRGREWGRGRSASCHAVHT